MKKSSSGKRKSVKSESVKKDGNSISHLDISRAAGVSPSLVSAFFSGNHYRHDRKSGIGIGEATRKLIIDTCHRLNYVPESPLGFFRLYPEKADVGYMLSDVINDGFANPYHSLIFEGFAKSAFAKSVDLSNVFFQSGHDYLLNPDALPNSILRGAIKKVAVSGGAPNYSLIYSLLKLDVSVVLVGVALPVKGVVSVVADFEEAGSLAIHTLHEHGHRRICVLANEWVNPSRYNGKMLWNGCLKAKGELGLSEKNIAFAQQPPLRPGEPLPSLAKIVLSMEPRPTAVFCLDDSIMRGLARELTAAGLSIPKDISVLGCNDDRINQEMSPGLSSIHLPCRGVGERAFIELTRIAVDGPPEDEENIVLPVRYVDNGTVRKI